MTAVKFEFNNKFDGGASDRLAQEKRLVEKRVKESREAGYSEGFTQGQTEALTGIESQASATLDRIEAQLTQFFTTQRQIEDKIRKDSVRLAVSIAKTLAPAVMKDKPMAEIESVVLECLETCLLEEKIIIRVPEHLSETLSESIENLKAKAGFEGDVQIKADPAITSQDCRIEWNNGGSERKEEDIMETIDNLINNYLAAPTTSEHALENTEAAAEAIEMATPEDITTDQ